MLPRRPGVPRLFPLIGMVVGCGLCWAQAHAPGSLPHPLDAMQFRSGLSEINEGWAEHDGDNLAWAQPDADTRGWKTVDDLDDLGGAEVGWRWYRKRVDLGPNHPHVHLLIEGGEGTYELYVNGTRMDGARLRSDFDVSRPTEQVFPLPDDAAVYVFALRTRAPASYAAYHLPLFMSVTLGQPAAIEYERQALESQRLYGVVTSVAINLALCLAGLGALLLFASQRMNREYLFLGLYLLLAGLSDGLTVCQQSGATPNGSNFLFGDPLIYFFSIAQIEFTFAFAGRRVGRAWRIYEALLLTPLIAIGFCWTGHLSANVYLLIEALITAPVPLLLPVLLFVWWRKGNREAALLILPIMLPAGTGIANALGSVSIFTGWGRFDFLAAPILLGPVPVQIFDIGTFLFLMAIGVVMFFRFTRVSREQARAAAELQAAREIQQLLVPASLPPLPGFAMEAAYLPATEVGGDFYQVLDQSDGATLIVIGDVSGKGLKAAMTGTLAIGALRTLAAEKLGPGKLLTRLNGEMARGQDGGFVTCLCVRISTDEMTVANAGHLAPYRNGEELSMAAGLPLGIYADAEYSESTFDLNAGEIITFLSDGVVEARNAAGELFGFERTQSISRQPAAYIAEAARRFGQEDDITVLTLTMAPTAVLSA